MRLADEAVENPSAFPATNYATFLRVAHVLEEGGGLSSLAVGSRRCEGVCHEASLLSQQLRSVASRSPEHLSLWCAG
jgi:hypothetical protein